MMKGEQCRPKSHLHHHALLTRIAQMVAVPWLLTSNHTHITEHRLNTMDMQQAMVFTLIDIAPISHNTRPLTVSS